MASVRSRVDAVDRGCMARSPRRRQGSGIRLRLQPRNQPRPDQFKPCDYTVGHVDVRRFRAVQQGGDYRAELAFWDTAAVGHQLCGDGSRVVFVRHGLRNPEPIHSGIWHGLPLQPGLELGNVVSRVVNGGFTIASREVRWSVVGVVGLLIVSACASGGARSDPVSVGSDGSGTPPVSTSSGPEDVAESRPRAAEQPPLQALVETQATVSDAQSESPEPITLVEAKRAAADYANRQTVALDVAPSGDVGWWATAWTHSDFGDIEMFCLATPGGGQCHPDGAHEMPDPVLALSSGETPNGLAMLVDPAVDWLSVRTPNGSESSIDVVDIGTTSGRRVAGFPLPDGLSSVSLFGLSSGVPFEVAVEINQPIHRAADGATVVPNIDASVRPDGPRELTD